MLEIYVVWHPDDDEGVAVATALIDHFHGTAFSGLIGGAVEVFIRSTGWASSAGPPRPLPFVEGLPNGSPDPELTIVVPVLGHDLSTAVSASPEWERYITEICETCTNRPESVGVVPVRLGHAHSAGRLAEILGHLQAVPHDPQDLDFVCREIAQAVAQFARRDVNPEPLTVFVSHTKHPTDEEQNTLGGLVDSVRRVIAGTHLADFFDARDLQPGHEWATELETHAATSALLVVRTDLYASRDWCQREMLIAKRAGMPIVILEALSGVEERGSFLMDHVPRVSRNRGELDSAIRCALGQLVDECLKRELWKRQQQLSPQAPGHEVNWWAPHAPEPTTLVEWLDSARASLPLDETILVLHPDPPLGRAERNVLLQVASLSGLQGRLEILTPRGLAVRGG